MATALIISPEFNPMQGDQDRTDREMARNEEVPKQSIEEIVREIKGEVADRRSVGDYPIGLEQQLEKYFSDMMRSLHERDLATKPMFVGAAWLGRLFFLTHRESLPRPCWVPKEQRNWRLQQ